MFKDSGRGGAVGSAARWNGRHAGNYAFTATMTIGYKSGSIFCYTLYAHRVIWAIHYGEWPSDQIDHINHDRADNRLVNLRTVSKMENSRNMSKPSNNTSGCVGIWLIHNGRWRAGIEADGERIHVGYFGTKSEAIKARKKAEVKYGFHKNHGR